MGVLKLLWLMKLLVEGVCLVLFCIYDGVLIVYGMVWLVGRIMG